MKLEDALQQLSTQLGSQFTINENGVCAILFNKKHEVAIAKADEQGEFIYMYGRVCPFPLQDRERLLLDLMQAHLFGHESHGAMFGVDENQEYIIAFIPLLLTGVDYPAFYNALDNLVATIDEYKQKLMYQHESSSVKELPKMEGGDEPSFTAFV